MLRKMKAQSVDTLMTMAAVGDIGLIRNVRLRIKEHGNGFPFEHVKDYFAKADLVFGNLEIPFSSKPSEKSNRHSSEFWADPATAYSLKQAGFTIMSFANNHTMEKGDEGLATTLSVLDGLGIQAVGAGEFLEDARKLVIKELKGIRVGFLAYAKTDFEATFQNGGAAPIESGIMLEDIKAARKTVDVLVVSLHFGMIYIDYPSDEGISLCHMLIDEGVDIILGHHPHVLQGIEEYGRGLIAYSLGEFIFDPEAGLWYSKLGRETRKESMVLMIKLDKQGYLGYSIIPTMLNREYQPEVPDNPIKSQILSRIDELSEGVRTLKPEQFYAYAGKRLVKYELNALLYHLKRLHFSYFIEKLSRIRGRHFRLFVGYLKNLMTK